MTIQKKSLISTLNTTKKAIVASTPAVSTMRILVPTPAPILVQTLARTPVPTLARTPVPTLAPIPASASSNGSGRGIARLNSGYELEL
jgi:hypothetical protein